MSKKTHSSRWYNLRCFGCFVFDLFCFVLLLLLFLVCDFVQERITWQKGRFSETAVLSNHSQFRPTCERISNICLKMFGKTENLIGIWKYSNPWYLLIMQRWIADIQIKGTWFEFSTPSCRYFFDATQNMGGENIILQWIWVRLCAVSFDLSTASAVY